MLASVQRDCWATRAKVDTPWLHRVGCFSVRWTTVGDRGRAEPAPTTTASVRQLRATRPGTSSVLDAFQPDDQIDHRLAGQDRHPVGGLHSHVPSLEKLAIDRHRAAVGDERLAPVDPHHHADGWKGATVCGRKPRQVGRPKRQDGRRGAAPSGVDAVAGGAIPGTVRRNSLEVGKSAI